MNIKMMIYFSVFFLRRFVDFLLCSLAVDLQRYFSSLCASQEWRRGVRLLVGNISPLHYEFVLAWRPFSSRDLQFMGRVRINEVVDGADPVVIVVG